MWTFCVCTRTLVQYTSSPCVYKCDNDEIVLVLHPLFNISSSPFNYSLNRSGTAFTAARMVSWGICDHSFSKDLLRESTLLWDLAQALVSRMDHSEKSIGFKSGLDGGHSTLEIKSGILVLRQDWVVLAWRGITHFWTWSSFTTWPEVSADIPAHTNEGFYARLQKMSSLISDHFGCLSPLRS